MTRTARERPNHIPSPNPSPNPNPNPDQEAAYAGNQKLEFGIEWQELLAELQVAMSGSQPEPEPEPEP